MSGLTPQKYAGQAAQPDLRLTLIPTNTKSQVCMLLRRSFSMKLDIFLYKSTNSV